MGTVDIVDSVTGSYGILKTNIRAAWPIAIYTLITSALALLLSTSISAYIIGTTVPSLGTATQLLSIAGLLPVVMWFAVIGIITVLIGPLLTGMYISGAAALTDSKRTIDIQSAFTAAKKRYLSLLGATVLSQAILLAAIAVPIALAVGLTLLHGAISPLTRLGGLGIAAFGAIIIAILFQPLLFLSVPLVMLEDKKAVASVKRSIDIGKQIYWKLLGIVILIGLIVLGVSIVIAIIYGVAAIVNVLAGQVAHLILSAIVGVFTSLLLIFAQVLAYKAFAGKPTSTNK